MPRILVILDLSSRWSVLVDIELGIGHEVMGSRLCQFYEQWRKRRNNNVMQIIVSKLRARVDARGKNEEYSIDLPPWHCCSGYNAYCSTWIIQHGCLNHVESDDLQKKRKYKYKQL